MSSAHQTKNCPEPVHAKSYDCNWHCLRVRIEADRLAVFGVSRPEPDSKFRQDAMYKGLYVHARMCMYGCVCVSRKYVCTEDYT